MRPEHSFVGRKRDDDIPLKREWVSGVLAAFFVLAFMLIILYGSVYGKEQTKGLLEGDVYSLKNGWEDGEGNSIEMPAELRYKNGQEYSYYLVMPYLGQELRSPVLFLRAKYINITVYLDGEKIGECLAKPEAVKDTLGLVPAVIELPPDYAGKKLQLDIKLQLGVETACSVPVPLVGARSSIMFEVLFSEAPNFLVLAITACFGIILLLFGIGGGRAKRDFAYTGIFALAFTCYSLCITDSVHFFVTNSYVIYLLEFMLLAFLPIPLVALLIKNSSGKGQKVLKINLAVLFLNFSYQAVVHFFTKYEMRQTVGVTHITLLFSIAVIVPVMCLNMKKEKKYLWMIIAFSPAIIGAALDLVMFYASSSYREAFGVQMGVLMFVILEAYTLIQSYLKYYENYLKTDVYQHMAYTDVLTGLGNRAAFEEKIENIQTKLNEYSSLWCVCGDVNNLKIVNDTQGHARGDELIRGAAEALKQMAEPGNVVFRTGGDEFIVFLFNTPEKGIEDGLARMEDSIRKFNAQHDINLSIAVGYDCFRFDKKDSILELLYRADEKMYQNKRETKNEPDTTCRDIEK